MTTVSEVSSTMTHEIPHESVRRRAGMTLAGLLGFYFVAAYLMMPALWEHYVHAHPMLDDVPTIVYTKTGIPGDPLNVGLIGTEAQVKGILVKAGWFPADRLSLKSDLEITEATVLKRQYDEAPVSNLYYDGRKEDLAFEQPIGPDPRKRNHVRFWLTKKTDTDGRPVWIGSATLDVRVGLSHTTGEITHHIGPDVDDERDHLMQNLQATGDLAEVYSIPGFHKKLSGKNGGGDPWHTDGTLRVGVIKQ